LLKADENQMFEIRINSQSLAVLNRDVYSYFKHAPFCSVHRIHLALASWGTYVNVNVQFIKKTYNLNRKTQDYDITGILWKIKQ
jgi:hypothetical protein